MKNNDGAATVRGGNYHTEEEGSKINFKIKQEVCFQESNI